ncbi:MAG: hypothetical protein AAF267_22595 [Deinococcota bacterium]
MAKVEDLHTLSQQLTQAGIVHALGGSGLLSYLDLAVEVNDWDLTTEAPLNAVEEALRGYDFVRLEPKGIYKSAFLLKLELPQSEADVIGGFAIADSHQVINIRTVVTGYWDGVPVGSAEEWLKAYRAMGRTRKAELLAQYLQQ